MTVRNILMVAIIVLGLIHNVYTLYVVEIKNDYSRSGEPTWVKEIALGQSEEVVLEIINNFKISYEIIYATLDDRFVEAERLGIKSICIDLKPRGLKRYPSNYYFVMELRDISPDEATRLLSENTKSLSDYTLNNNIHSYDLSSSYTLLRHLPVVTIPASIAFAVLAWDNFVQAGRISDTLDYITDSNKERKLKQDRTRKILSGFTCSAASISMIAFTIKITNDIRVYANQSSVTLKYDF